VTKARRGKEDVSGSTHPAEESFGQRLRRLRAEKGLSQQAVSGPGVTPAYVSRIEVEDLTPSVRAIRVLAKKLGVRPEYLETGLDLPEHQQRELRLSEAELELRLGDDPDPAEQSFREILSEATRAGDELSALRAQVGLGLSAEQRGDHEQAITLLEEVVASAYVSPLTHAQAFAALGHAYVVLDQGERAAELFRSCLERIDRANGDPSAYVRFATYLSYTLSDLGDLAGARRAIADALAKADEHTDPYTRIRLYWSQARLAASSGDVEAAKRNIGRAIALLEASEDSLHLGRAHLLNAEILLAGGQEEEAAEHLERAEDLLGGQADSQDRAHLLIERGRLAARQGRAAEATALADTALDLVGDQDETSRGRALWVVAEAHAAGGDLDEALSVMEDAVTLLRGETRFAVEVLRSQAALLERAGRVEDALEVLKQVTALLQRSMRSASEPARETSGEPG
jgi:tetratricopeptide (TPR) repeat protein